MRLLNARYKVFCVMVEPRWSCLLLHLKNLFQHTIAIYFSFMILLDG